MVKKKLILALATILLLNKTKCLIEDINIGVISIPKAGTHLALKIVQLLTNKPYNFIQPSEWTILPQQVIDKTYEKILAGHLIFNSHNNSILAKNNYRAIFIIRDPRDQVISTVYWIYKNIDLWPNWRNFTFNNVISKIIHKTADRYATYLPWKNNALIYTTTFEKLVGPTGGGSKEDQINEIKNIAFHLGIKIPLNKIEELANQLFGNTITFREGQIGSWKKYFRTKDKENFKKVAGQLLIDLGYEKDLNW